MGLMLRQIGNRVGQEIAFSMRGIEHDIEFLDEMMDWWEYAGLGKLEYDVDPTFHVRVGLHHPPLNDPDALPMWEMDDGIIEGALMARYPETGNVRIRREMLEDDDGPTWRYTLIFIDEDLDEASD